MIHIWNIMAEMFSLWFGISYKWNVYCKECAALFDFHWQVYAWGDNDHGQQGNGTTTVNRKPTLVQGLEGQKITRVACGSSHSVAWTTMDVATPSVHEPVLFQTARDPLGASYLGNIKLAFFPFKILCK